MDGDLYDEFGNYIGPDLESDDSSVEDDTEEPELEDEVTTHALISAGARCSQSSYINCCT